MDQSCLVSVLAQKYGLSANTDEEVMQIFNRLCMSVENQQTIDKVQQDMNKMNEEFHKLLEVQKKRLNSMETALLTIMQQLPDARNICEKLGVSMVNNGLSQRVDTTL